MTDIGFDGELTIVTNRDGRPAARAPLGPARDRAGARHQGHLASLDGLDVPTNANEEAGQLMVAVDRWRP